MYTLVRDQGVNHVAEIRNMVGRKVRKTIHELGGTMPKNMPVAESIKKVESGRRESKPDNPNNKMKPSLDSISGG